MTIRLQSFLQPFKRDLAVNFAETSNLNGMCLGRAGSRESKREALACFLEPWTLQMAKGLFKRFSGPYELGLTLTDPPLQLMLQTAPVLLLFPPTVGPDAKPDAQAIRYDFTMGCVRETSTHVLSPDTFAGNNRQSKSMIGLFDSSLQDRSRRSIGL